MLKSGFIGIIGQPNAGKSTLINLLINEDVSIVSQKPQTTRKRILGIVNHRKSQLIFVDAPGIIESNKGLNKFLEAEALDVVKKSDCLLAVVALDTDKMSEVEKIFTLVQKSKKKTIVLINKLDLARFHHRVVKIKELFSKLENVFAIHEFSKNWGSDVAVVKKSIFDGFIDYLPEHKKFLYEDEIYTPHTIRDLVSEIIRESCFNYLEKEIPYNLTIEIIKYEELDKIDKIYANIITARESHKPIIIGQKASVIKKIGVQARRKIEKLVNKKVFLSLEVKILENWHSNAKFMKEQGYVIQR